MLPAVQEDILTVTQITATIRELLENRYRFVRVCGEISNLKTPFSGHSYFTLKDAGAQLRVVLFKQQKRFVAEDPSDGQQVVVFGRISVYEPRGEYQLIADSLESYGIGKLLRDFELLKKRLGDRGFFNVERKKPLPAYPRSIVVITSPTGAAIQDFLKILAGRDYPLLLRILPVKVQGKEAPAEIVAALTLAQNLHADAIVLCRGGGSIEDLWAFNDEQVAEAIYRSTIPVVTGIGHETDSTIADFCADCRCPTPTAAAERLIPDGMALRQRVSALREKLNLYLDHKVQDLEQRLRLQRHRLGSMGQRCSRLEFRLQLSNERFLQAMHEAMVKRERRLAHAAGELRRRLSMDSVDLRRRHLEHLRERLRHHIDRVIANKEGQLAQLASLLQGLSPLATLARGYAVVRTPSPRSDGRELVVETKDVEVGDRLDVYLRDGRLDCLVAGKAPGALAVPSLAPPQPSNEEVIS